MLDIKLVAEQKELLKEALRNRHSNIEIDELVAKNEHRRALQQEVEVLRNRRNVVSEEVGRLKREKRDTAAIVAEMKEVSDNIKTLGDTIKALEEDIRAQMLVIPNVPHVSVPVGKDETENVEIRRWGEPTMFGTQINKGCELIGGQGKKPEDKTQGGFEPLNHWDIGKALGIIDFERAAKIASARFSLMIGAGACLERALMNFMLNHNVKRGYTEVFPPILVNRESTTATGQLPKFEIELFRTLDPELYLVPTAEIPVTNIHRDEILQEEDLPIYYTAYTPCFRREAGSYGKDTRGLIRQHQFNKVELVKFVKPENSYDELERLTEDAEDILRQLNLPYRVILLCTGDMGFSSAKTYDIEVWFPAQNRYREISSCSNFEDFQARRGSIRFKRGDKKGTEFVHTLNGSALAIGRTVAAILENYQQADGSVIVPEVLRHYMGMDVIR